MRTIESRVRSEESGVRNGILLLFILLVPICTFQNALAEVNGADSLVAEVETKLAAINDLSGSFTQSSYIKDLEETQQYAGEFYIKKPSSIMWEYKSPRDEKIIMQKDTTWIHKKSQNQVIKSTFSKESYNQAPIAMLTSMVKLKDDYDITMPEKNALHLIPKRKIGSVQMIVIETLSGNFPVRTLTIFDNYGNIVIIELSDVKINQKLDASLFQFITPPGAEVYDMSQ
jgi:outer membrane lipoprotein carrier protein